MYNHLLKANKETSSHFWKPGRIESKAENEANSVTETTKNEKNTRK
jgi:hypothetical protein